MALVIIDGRVPTEKHWQIHGDLLPHRRLKIQRLGKGTESTASGCSLCIQLELCNIIHFVHWSIMREYKNASFYHSTTTYACTSFWSMITNFGELGLANSLVLHLDNSPEKIEMEGAYDLGFQPMVFLVERGEDVGDTILSYIQNRENFPAHLREKTCLGLIMSAFGNVLNPELEIQEPSMLVDGVYEIICLNGTYEMPKDGDAHITGGLAVSLSGQECALGGAVAGSLVADTPIQVCVFIAEVKETTFITPEDC